MDLKYYHHISIRLLADEQTEIPEDLSRECGYFSSGFRLQFDRTVAPLALGVIKDESLGELWRGATADQGYFEFELGAELPFFIPHPTSRPEFSVEIDDQRLNVSTRMTRCFVQDRDTDSDLIYWLVHRRCIGQLREKAQLESLAVLPIPTFVATRFRVQANSAETAVQDHFMSWADHLTLRISRLVETLRGCAPDAIQHALPVLAPHSFSAIWLTLRGSQTAPAQQFAVPGQQFGLKPLTSLDETTFDSALEVLATNKSIEHDGSMLGLARAFAHNGYLDLAIIQLCTACELILARKFREFATHRGVSKQKYDAAKRDIGYSHLLNLHLPTMLDVSDWDDYEGVTAKLNHARRWRNDIVHEGKRNHELDQAKVDEAIEAGADLVLYLRQSSVPQDC